MMNLLFSRIDFDSIATTTENKIIRFTQMMEFKMRCVL